MMNEKRNTESVKNTDQTEKKTWMPPELSTLDMEETSITPGSGADGAVVGPSIT